MDLRLAEIRDPDGPEFAAAYAMLDAYFGPLGELEDRDVLAGFVRDRILRYAPGVEGSYHLVGAWAGDQLVGVRDCYVDVDEARGLSLVALSHVLVAPTFRGRGLGRQLRELPVVLAREIQLERYGRTLPTLVAAEMEPADPAEPETLHRLVTYGRSGFSVLDPRRFRYAQPDFRSPRALPMLGVVRPLDLPEDALPVEVAAMFPRLFHVCHRMYLPAERVDPCESFALATLAERADPVPLLPLPRGPDDVERLAPLLREAVEPLYRCSTRPSQTT